MRAYITPPPSGTGICSTGEDISIKRNAPAIMRTEILILKLFAARFPESFLLLNG
jgi:hypothetical protein